jgi:hypothetical protein
MKISEKAFFLFNEVIMGFLNGFCRRGERGERGERGGEGILMFLMRLSDLGG